MSTVMHRVPASLERLRDHDPSDVLLSTPAAAEVWFGLARLRRSSRRRRLLEDEYRRLRELVGWVDWTEEAAEEFGRQKARLAARGRPIEDMDVAIASIALVQGARVATHNAGHLSRVADLTVDDWGPPQA